MEWQQVFTSVFLAASPLTVAVPLPILYPREQNHQLRRLSEQMDNYILIDGFAYNTRGYFASCVVFFRAPKGRGKMRAMSKMSGRIISIKRFIIPLQNDFFNLAFFLVRVLRNTRHYLSTKK